MICLRTHILIVPHAGAWLCVCSIAYGQRTWCSAVLWTDRRRMVRPFAFAVIPSIRSSRLNLLKQTGINWLAQTELWDRAGGPGRRTLGSRFFGWPGTGFSRRNGEASPDSLARVRPRARPLCVCLAMPQHSTDALAILPCDSQNAWCVDQCCVSARVLNECIHVLPLLSHTLSFSRALSLALSLSRSSSLPLSLPLPACACVCACECRAVQALFNLQWNGKKVCFVLCGSAECMYVFVE